MVALNGDVYPRYTYVSSSMADRRASEPVHDNVHGSIYLDPLSLKFVDTEQFRRLQDLKQLGLSYLVYPGAVHSRFEHSLGVYWLAGETVHKIKIDQGSELDIDKFDIQAVKLAGLLHDVGHGPFSHFEKEFLPKFFRNQKWSHHEEMSLKMIDYIVDEHNIEIESDVQKKVKEMIVASSEDTSSPIFEEKRFLYDIVANGRNGVDVDKFDYIVRDSQACGLTCSFWFDRPLDTMRVIGDEICYHAKEYSTMYQLFSSYRDLQSTIYTNAKVKAIELMVVDALTKADEYLDILCSLNDPAEYWKLDDSLIKRIETSTNQENKESRDLILRIRRNDLYQLCKEFLVPKDKLEYFKDVTPQDIICSQKAGVATLKEEDIVVSNIKIDMRRGTKNPLESISFFKDNVSDEKFCIPDVFLSNCCQDKIVRVYSKKPELVEVVSDAFENFEANIFGPKKTERMKRSHSDEHPDYGYYPPYYYQADEEDDLDDEENPNPEKFEGYDSAGSDSESSDNNNWLYDGHKVDVFKADIRYQDAKFDKTSSG